MSLPWFGGLSEYRQMAGVDRKMNLEEKSEEDGMEKKGVISTG